METDLRIEGANCPSCLDATVDALRVVPGVDDVRASVNPGWLVIEHDDDVDVLALVANVHDHLHRVTMAAAEIVMTSIDPVVVDLRCAHHPS